ncbi:MAG: response regulator [Eubacterium sp.]|nr:response regulator [Eubacterium sp.]
MKKVILADDEIVILNGLQKLIHWEELKLELVGVAEDGQELLEMVKEKKPHLVVSDIMMPRATGLEVLKQLKEEGREDTKFIFISGYEEFSFAREAIALGAVDYLLKPVSREDLESAIKKATNQIEERTAVEAFKDDEEYLKDLFQTINEGSVFDKNTLYERFADTNMDFTDKFFVGLSVGLLPEPRKSEPAGSFAKRNLARFTMFNRLIELFREEKTGFLLQKEENKIHLIGVFPNEDKHCFYEKYVHPKRMEIEMEYDINLLVGIGMRTEDMACLKNVYKTAKFANELFFFEERAVIDFEDIKKEYHVSFEDYQQGVENVFHSIIAKDGNVLKNVQCLMDMIRQIHYGNQYAAKARVMHFTGDLGMKLHNYKLLSGDFYHMQDKLQEKVESQVTFRGMHTCIMNHYEQLIAEIYRTEKSKDTVLIETVKKYIQNHYADDLSVKELADLACVSINYFSAMFKRETGQNYKAYLTGIRMEKALELLLNTDLKTYEIGEAVGYNNVRRFVDAFKQLYGMSPMDYRKKHYKN